MSHAEKTDPIERAERAGRKGDRLLGHLTPGDVVIPRGRVTPELRALLAPHMDLDRYTAGHESNSVNPRTGLPEFFDIGSAFGGTGGFDMGSSIGLGLGAAEKGAEQGLNTAMGMANPAEGVSDMSPGLNAQLDQALAQARARGDVSPWESIKNFFSNPTAPALAPDSAFGNVNSAQGDFGNGALQDSTQSPWVRADYTPITPPQVVGPVVPNNVNPLMAPQTPDLPTTPVDPGRYYGALLNQDMALANNLLGPYLSGNKNVYGR